MTRRLRRTMRITITSPHPSHAPLLGRTGVVVRELHRSWDPSAWVQMDERIDGVEWPFPASDARGSNLLIHPDECEMAE